MKLLPLVLLAVVLFGLAPRHAGAANVAVVLSSDAAAYQEAVAGFREVTRHRIASVQLLAKDPATWREELKKLRSVVEPDLIFVIGTSALQAVAAEVANIPTVYAMVFNPSLVRNPNNKNIVGVSMVPPASQYASLMKQLNPNYRRIGTILNPEQPNLSLREQRSSFEKAGFQLVTREIRSPGEIGGALKSLEKEIDLFWLWPDETLLADDIVQRIILFSFERRIPVLGLSQRHTDMGAVLSLSYESARDMGRQAAEMANGLLSTSVDSQPMLIAPRRTRFTINLKSARNLNVRIPESMLKRADNAVQLPVYREGDWWVFRTKTMEAGSVSKTQIQRVVFREGSFECDDHEFLPGGDSAGQALFLPFASVYLSNPERKWLEFPLIGGKTWSFRYRRIHYSKGLLITSDRFANAEAEVVGKTLVETQAGQFDAMEIVRKEHAGAPAFLTYFYAPKAQSVVKLRAERFGGAPAQYELELVGYGNGGSLGKNLR